MKYFFITIIALFTVLLLSGVKPACAYPNVTNTPDGGCLICHAFAGGTGSTSATLHATHVAVPVSCFACHPDGTPGKNVTSSKCIACHPRGNIGKCNLVELSAHPTAGVQACITCHSTCAVTTTTTVPAGDCTLIVSPNNFTVLGAAFFPVQFFYIAADINSSISFVYPICIYWESAGIDDTIKLILGEKLIIGFIRVDPGNLTAGNYSVQVTYGDLDEKACGPIVVQDSGTSRYLSALSRNNRITAQRKCGK
jgi:hypothetical protein